MLSDGVPISVGQKLNVTIRGEKFNLQILGWRSKQYLILEAPQVNGEPYRVIPQTGIIVSFVRDGEYIEFKSSVIVIYPNVVLLMVIEFPKNVEIHKLRKYSRFKTNFRFSYILETPQGNIEDYGNIRDISSSGLLLSHGKQLTKLKKIKVQATLIHGTVEGLECQVQNVRHNPKSANEPYVTGVKILGISESNRNSLHQFIESRVGERRNRKR